MLSELDSKAITLLTFYVKDGLIGYAHGGRDEELPAIEHAVDRGWIVYSHDASVGGRRDPEGRPFQQRDVYRITAAGRAMLTDAGA